jgi:hypothetical protein
MKADFGKRKDDFTSKKILESFSESCCQPSTPLLVLQRHQQFSFFRQMPVLLFTPPNSSPTPTIKDFN